MPRQQKFEQEISNDYMTLIATYKTGKTANINYKNTGLFIAFSKQKTKKTI